MVNYDKRNHDKLIESDKFIALASLRDNIEHAVHHMAIMKIGIREVAPYVNLSSDFGIAVSTLRYQEAGTFRVR